jgi:hypothetical protein
VPKVPIFPTSETLGCQRNLKFRLLEDLGKGAHALLYEYLTIITYLECSLTYDFCVFNHVGCYEMCRLFMICQRVMTILRVLGYKKKLYFERKYDIC